MNDQTIRSHRIPVFPSDTRDLFCNRCDEPLKPELAVWLELNTNTGIYHSEGQFPKDGLSQGCFEFGATCAKKIANREGPETVTHQTRKATCLCGTKAKLYPRRNRRRYRHKCPHGSWCGHGRRVSQITCKECVAERVAKMKANDEGYQRHLNRNEEGNHVT